MAIDCIPHTLGQTIPHVRQLSGRQHFVKLFSPVVFKAATTPLMLKLHVRLRECPSGATVTPLADLNSENIAAIYMLPYTGAAAVGDSVVSKDAVATVETEEASPADASGLDLPTGGLGDIEAPGRGAGSSIGVPSGRGGSTGGGGGSGGSASIGGGSTSSGSKGLGLSAVGGRGAGPLPVVAPPYPPVIGGTPSPVSGHDPAADGGVSESGVVAGVPEPTTWALVFVGLGAAGASLRGSRQRTLVLQPLSRLNGGRGNPAALHVQAA